MVRLLRKIEMLQARMRKAFQSHNGAIAATMSLSPSLASGSFQSHNGAIAALSELLQEEVEAQFQSHNGAIAANARHVAVPTAVGCFNPTMVRLLRIQDSFVVALWRRFNPTMVRLLPKALRREKRLQAKFQSHNGAIAARSLRSSVSLSASSFNPTMVRLLPRTGGHANSSSQAFQSHNGAIAAKS